MWDNKYRILTEGEIIIESDEFLDDVDDEGKWRKTSFAGEMAPNPGYTPHRIYRRLKEEIKNEST